MLVVDLVFDLPPGVEGPRDLCGEWLVFDSGDLPEVREGYIRRLRWVKHMNRDRAMQDLDQRPLAARLTVTECPAFTYLWIPVSDVRGTAHVPCTTPEWDAALAALPPAARATYCPTPLPPLAGLLMGGGD